MSFDEFFWYDSSPEWREYLNTSWSVQSAPIFEAMQETLDSFRKMGENMSNIADVYGKAWIRSQPNPVGPAYHYTVDEAGKVVVGNAGAEAIIPIQTIFTDDLGRIEDGSGASTHDDRGRPVLGPSGGVPRPASLCPRHGLPMDSGWCRRCRR